MRHWLILSRFQIDLLQSFVDFSLHIPGISTLLAVILSVGLINFRKTNVNVICVEVLDYDKRKKKQLLNFFKKNNYFLKKRVSINYIFQKKS